MMKFERIEKAILIFLIAALLLGITVSALRKARPHVVVKIEKFNTEKYKTALDDIGSSDQKININNANVEELMKIKGIGKTTAGRIIEYRYNNGSFVSIDDIKNVKGVGAALFEKIRNRIKVE